MDLLRIERGGRLLLWRRGPDEALLPSHWGLPERRHLPSARVGPRLRSARHSITHHDIRVRVFSSSAPAGKLSRSARWATPRDARALLVASLWKKALAR